MSFMIEYLYMIVVFITVLGSCPRMREGLEEGWMQEQLGKKVRAGIRSFAACLPAVGGLLYLHRPQQAG